MCSGGDFCEMSFKGLMDPRAIQALSLFPTPEPVTFDSREQILDHQVSGPIAMRQASLMDHFKVFDDERISSSAGLRIEKRAIESSPDGNTINLQIIRKASDDTQPCVYYIHGGAMATLSCFLPNYRAWGKMLAQLDVTVVMVDFRNSVSPSSVPEIAPFPGGLNDCIAGFKWTAKNSETLGIDPERIIIAGDSGGGNLAISSSLSLLEGEASEKPSGLYVICPYIAGDYSSDELKSVEANNGIFIDVKNNLATMGYGIEHLIARNPLAWPHFVDSKVLRALPPTVVSVNEFDPLRDEGLMFFRKLLDADVRARCRTNMGVFHAIEVFPTICPDISWDTAMSVASLASDSSRIAL